MLSWIECEGSVIHLSFATAHRLHGPEILTGRQAVRTQIWRVGTTISATVAIDVLRVAIVVSCINCARDFADRCCSWRGWSVGRRGVGGSCGRLYISRADSALTQIREVEGKPDVESARQCRLAVPIEACAPDGFGLACQKSRSARRVRPTDYGMGAVIPVCLARIIVSVYSLSVQEPEVVKIQRRRIQRVPGHSATGQNPSGLVVIPHRNPEVTGATVVTHPAIRDEDVVTTGHWRGCRRTRDGGSRGGREIKDKGFGDRLRIAAIIGLSARIDRVGSIWQGRIIHDRIHSFAGSIATKGAVSLLTFLPAGDITRTIKPEFDVTDALPIGATVSRIPGNRLEASLIDTGNHQPGGIRADNFNINRQGRVGSRGGIGGRGIEVAGGVLEGVSVGRPTSGGKAIKRGTRNISTIP